MIAREGAWTETTKSDWGLKWVSCNIDNEELIQQLMLKNKIMNRFPNSKELAHKDVFSHMMKFAQEMSMDDYDFVPPTFSLPGKHDEARLNEYMKSHATEKPTYIAKPDVGAQGEGMCLFNEFKDIPYALDNKDVVIQRYLDRPLLLDGIKFDLRVYVMVVGLTNMKAYICDEGLARFCTVSPPSYKFLNCDFRRNTSSRPDPTSKSLLCT